MTKGLAFKPAASQPLHGLPPCGTPQPVAQEAKRQANYPIGAVGFGRPLDQTGKAGAPNLPTHLPAWADNDEGRALLARIVAEQPDETRPLTQTMCGTTASWGYRGKAANALRKLYNRALGEIADEERALFEAGESYAAVHNRLVALMNGEQPDALIRRVLA